MKSTNMVQFGADLFKVTDRSRMQVFANPLEEQLPALQALQSFQRLWKVKFDTDPTAPELTGLITDIGTVIDPTNHTGTCTGWVENPEGRLRAGQFATAYLPLPPDLKLVAVPLSALVEDGERALVFVQIDAAKRRFERRTVAVVVRGRERVLLRRQPTDEEARRGAQPIDGEATVLSQGAMFAASELEVLEASGKHPE